MSETIITVPVRSVETITAEIYGIARQTSQILLLSACEMGKRMLEVKSLAAHGEWGERLEEICNGIGISQSTAHNWMRLHREYGDSPNLQSIGNLNYTNAVKLLALPEEERAEFVESHDVESMSARELEQAIKEKKAAQEMLAVAQENANGMAQQIADQAAELDKLRTSLDTARKKPAISEADRDKLRAEGAEKARAEMAGDLEAKEVARKALAEALAATEKENRELHAAQQMSSKDAAGFEVLFNQMLDMENRLIGYLLKVEGTDAALGKKLRGSVRKLGEKLVADAGRCGS